MAEQSQQLRTTLVELHDQLAHTREITPEVRAMLAGLASEIERLLAEQRSGQPSSAAATSRGGQHESLIARLGEAARDFEDTHPTLAGTIGSIIDALGQMGI
jgi:uncharacterized small protein (DUF1192 family)